MLGLFILFDRQLLRPNCRPSNKICKNKSTETVCILRNRIRIQRSKTWNMWLWDDDSTSSPNRVQQPAPNPMRRTVLEVCFCLALWCVVISVFVSEPSSRALQAPLLRSQISSVPTTQLRYLAKPQRSVKTKEKIRRILRFLNDGN